MAVAKASAEPFVPDDADLAELSRRPRAARADPSTRERDYQGLVDDLRLAAN